MGGGGAMSSPPSAAASAHGLKSAAAAAMSAKTADLIHSAKKEIRSELSLGGWSRRGYWKPDRPELPPTLDNMERIHCRDVTAAQFHERYEVPARPVVIDGFLDDMDARRWTAQGLHERFCDMKFKCGEDDDGYPERVRLKYFMEYCATEATTDDSPLYIFDSRFADSKYAVKDSRGRTLFSDYRVPCAPEPPHRPPPPRASALSSGPCARSSYFSDDLFKLVGEKRRPPYRWFMIGPPRSGTGIHTDPLGTSAWNMLAEGHKRWVIFPPGAPRHLVKPDEYKGVDREAITWFQEVLPRLLREQPALAATRLDFIQRPGETVFVPGHWWHVVTNLDTTVAVTQNFASPANFAVVWKETIASRPRMAARWLCKLAEHPTRYRAEVAHALQVLAALPGSAALWGTAGQAAAAVEGRVPEQQTLRRFLVSARHRRKRERKEKKRRKREKRKAKREAERRKRQRTSEAGGAAAGGGGSSSSSSSSS